MTELNQSNSSTNPKMTDKFDENTQDTLSKNPTMDNDYLFAASATDMTGLIPNGGHTDSELNNYEEIYPYLAGGIINAATGIPEPPILPSKLYPSGK